jgi:hypothetical protein
MLVSSGASSARLEETLSKRKTARKPLPKPELPPMQDLESMTNAELLEFALNEYTKLQRIWYMELVILPQPDWTNVEEVSRQMKRLEEAVEPLRYL